MQFHFGAYVVAALFDSASQAIFALGDGCVHFADKASVEAHPDAAILCAAIHPSGVGVITGGDDGRVVWSTAEAGAVELARFPGKWIDALAVSEATNLVAFATGREVHVRDLADQKFSRLFAHSHSVADLAFDAKGRKLACATYNGAAVWFSRIADQKPQFLKWAGSHTRIAYSPDGKFLITAMQENALHGWRLSDSKDMRMGGYPAKVRTLSFLAKGKLLATAGAQGAVVWPFLKANGPMGEQASEINPQDGAFVTCVAGAEEETLLAGGLDDGRVWIAELREGGIEWIRRDKGSPISALAISPDGYRVAFGDEDGFAMIFEAEA